MSVEVENNLRNARSAYLRSARHQPVDWQEWSAEAFAQAQRENKPILLDIGAVWCHWCHVMDRESYENAETAALINEHFLAIKVDRDERPDIDARYQAAVAAISGQGGWPLTALLTPQGKPFFGGTYFPPTDQHGRPGLRRVLATLLEAFHERRAEVEESALSVMAAIEANETFDGSGELTGLVDKIVASALGQFDPRHGGFGSQPKFPNSAALDLLLDTGARPGPYAEQSRQAVMVTLEKMSKGGIYDHLAGGFHRYSVDERWVVPHFEKMSYDNSGLLRNYVHAWQSTGEHECARIARETIAWIDAQLCDRERGGFYSSQDADFSLDDDGDYFTWTRAEALAVLTPGEMAVVELFFDLGPIGDMQHNPEKNVLHIDLPLPQVAKAAGVTLEQAAAIIAAARPKLHAARLARPTPYIDKTIYTAWNAMMVTAWLEAGQALDLPGVTNFALKSLDRALAGVPHVVPSEAPGNVGAILPHVLAYGEPSTQAHTIPGLLDDYVLTATAALDAWQSTGEYRYYEAAFTLAEATIEKFHDPEKNGFFDTENASEPQLGALSTRRKPIQDAPTPAGNSVAAALLLRLAELTGREDFRALAQSTLEGFAGIVEHFGLYAASYGQALTRLVQPPTRVVIVGASPAAEALTRAALNPYRLTTTIIRLRTLPTRLPPALAETIPNLPVTDQPYALVCTGQTCRPPVQTPEALTAALRGAP